MPQTPWRMHMTGTNSQSADVFKEQPFKPVMGLDRVVVKPGPAGTALLPPSLAEGPSCIFTYSSLREHDLGHAEFAHGAVVEFAWVYGAREGGDDVASQYAIPTGSTQDTLAGNVMCWQDSKVFAEKLAASDAFRQVADGINSQKSSVRRGVLTAVVRSGSARRAYWYYYHKALYRAANSPEASVRVKETCIACGTCYWLSPTQYGASQENGQAYAKAPSGGVGAPLDRPALQAVAACPVGAITFSNPECTQRYRESMSAITLKPQRQAGLINLPEGVYYIPAHAEGSFGASSWLITRKNGGNILVDLPRLNTKLAQNIASYGPVDYMYFTHQDDCADHADWQALLTKLTAVLLSCHADWQALLTKLTGVSPKRIIHKTELPSWREGLGDSEIQWEGETFYPDPSDKRFLLIYTPGHTKGSTVGLWDNTALFTGDHMAGRKSDERGGQGSDPIRLQGFRDACWYDWPTLIRSTEKLLAYPFTYVLTGHGAPAQFASVAEAHAALSRGIEHMPSMQKRSGPPST
eukprot:g60887.t1